VSRMVVGGRAQGRGAGGLCAHGAEDVVGILHDYAQVRKNSLGDGIIFYSSKYHSLVLQAKIYAVNKNFPTRIR
jgi:hypothetical protein